MTTGFLDRTTSMMGNERRYVVHVPRSWDGKTPLPAILFLHGSGESGTDGLKQIAVGLGPAMQLNRDTWPFLAVFPQKCDMESSWEDEAPLIDIVLDEVQSEWPIDPQRRYLTGLSQGGRGTFVLAKQLMWRFAAAAPVCGWARPDEVRDLVDLPLWAFHGMKDNVVKPSGTIEPLEWLQKQGAPARMTLYEEDNHNSWDSAYRTTDLAAWFLRHTL